MDIYITKPRFRAHKVAPRKTFSIAANIESFLKS
jgi:hypothetical protein